MVNWKRFERLWNKEEPVQEKFEYYLFLQFVQSYFKYRQIRKPVVVEIGVKQIKQRYFYEAFLGANWYGIDIVSFSCPKICLGNSSDSSTLERLKCLLKGRMIDLLFIDGNHDYSVVKMDWQMYSVLTAHLVAFHDINLQGKEYTGSFVGSVYQLWNELKLQGLSMVEFNCPGLIEVVDGSLIDHYLCDPGIGVVLLDRGRPEVGWKFDDKTLFELMWGRKGKFYARTQGKVYC